MHWREIIRRPVVTEKSGYMATMDQYTFVVDPRANKIMIKQAVEQAFDVTVDKVRIINMPAKRGKSLRNRQMRVRKAEFKKAIVTLSEGNIELFEGV